MPVIRGRNRAETLRGDAGADVIHGGAGDDLLYGVAGADLLLGGEGADSLHGGAGSDTLDGGAGADWLAPGTNLDRDVVRASFGADTVDFAGAAVGSAYEIRYHAFARIELRIGPNSADTRKFALDFLGDETLESIDRLTGLGAIGPGGTLTVSGTTGDDSFIVNRATGPELIFDVGRGRNSVTGDARTREVVLLATPTPSGDEPGASGGAQDQGVRVRVSWSTASGQMTGTAEPLAGLNASTAFRNVDLIVGTGRNDMFTGGAGADAFGPGEGDDGMDGGAGFDTISYDDAGIAEMLVDLALGEASVVHATSAGRRVFSDGLRNVEAAVGSPAGRDVLRGSGAANRLEGQGGDDRLDGRGGADTLAGGDGDDRLWGGAGRDLFVFDGDDGDDRISGFENRLDRIRILDGAAAFSDLSIAQAGRNAVIGFGDTSVTLLRVDQSLIDASDFLFG